MRLSAVILFVSIRRRLEIQFGHRVEDLFGRIKASPCIMLHALEQLQRLVVAVVPALAVGSDRQRASFPGWSLSKSPSPETIPAAAP